VPMSSCAGSLVFWLAREIVRSDFPRRIVEGSRLFFVRDTGIIGRPCTQT
jgi:hypothetical protein